MIHKYSILVSILLFSLIFFATAGNADESNNQGFFVSPPAWKFDNAASRDNQFTFEIGQPFSGSVGNLGFVIGGSYSLNSGNTTLCVFDAMINGTCIEPIFDLVGSWKVENLMKADNTDGFIFDARYRDTGEVVTYRWSSVYGTEWWISRGNTARRNTLIVDSTYNTLLGSSATENGLTENIIASATIDHKYVQFWSTPIPLPAGFNQPWTSFARDLTWMNNFGGVPTAGFISVGRVFALSTDDGKVLNQVDLPCGYNSTDFKMKAVSVKYNHAILVVYGNVPNNGFVVCALAFNSSLTQLWSIQMNETFTAANGDDSVAVIRTSYNNGFFPVPTDHLFISGVKPGNFNNSFLWCFNVEAASFVWEIPRKYADRFNMPVFFGGYADEHVAVTINGTIVGLDPVNQNQKWKCNWGCQGSAANYRHQSGQIGRMTCIDATSAFRVISMTIDPNYTCSLTWQTTLKSEVDVQQQNAPGLVTTTWAPLEPFVTVLTPDGTVWTMSVRPANQPAPTPFPTPAPTPAPTLPPTNAPAPNLKYAFQAPYDFTDLTLTKIPVVAASSTDGPAVAAVGEATVWLDATKKKRHALKAKGFNDEQNKNKLTTHLGLGNLALVFYYQTIPLSQSSAEMEYSYIALPITYYINTPQTVFAGNNQYVALSGEENGDGDLILLYTNPSTQTPGNDVEGAYQLIGRAGADSRAAADGTGLFFYSYGVVDNYHDEIKAKYQTGAGYATAPKWVKQLGDGVTKYTNFSSHVSDLLFAYSGGNGYVVFSYLNTLRVQNVQDGGDARLPITNPCGFQPTTNTWEVYYPMDMFWVKSPSENVALALIDVWDQHGDGSYGLCGVNLSSTAGLSTTYGILLQNISFISNVQAIGNSNLFAIDAETLDWRGVMMVFDATTGASLYTRFRHKSFGAVIIPVPEFGCFFTNIDVTAPQYMALGIMDARSGKTLGIADVACSVFTLVQGTYNGYFDIICAVQDYPAIVRCIRFTPSSNQSYVTSTVWETNVGVDVMSMSQEDTIIIVDQQMYIILQLEDGTVVAVSPQAGAAPTPVPPIPTGDAHPASVTITNLSPRWVTPATISPTLTDVGSTSYKYGSVSFTSVDAGIAGISSEDTADARYTVLLAYQAQAPAGTSTVYNNIPYTLPFAIATWDPVWMGNNAQRSAAAIATMFGDGLVVILAFPNQAFPIARRGAVTPVTSDGEGSVFFSIGSNGESELFACYKLADDGMSISQTWNVSVYPRADSGFVTPANTSHIGAPTFSVANGRGYVTFSWLNSTYTLNAQTGARVSESTLPCGFAPPLDPFSNNAPFPMYPVVVTLANTSSIMTTRISTSTSYSNGFWAICATSTDGKYSLWSQQLNLLTPSLIAEVVMSTTDIFGTDYFVIDMTTQPLGAGYMVGFQATTGNYWIKSRAKSTGTAPAVQAYAGQYMVLNWDDPSHTDKFLSLVDATSGATSVQCSWACLTQPAAASVIIAGSTQTVYVCALNDHANVIRAVYFKRIDGQTGYTCETYWEYTLLQNSNSVSPAGASTIAVGLAAGGTATFSIASSVAPITPVPQETTPTPPQYTTPSPGNNNNQPGSSGLSGGVAAAITILALLAVAIAVGGIYLIRRRNVRRSALNEASAGMEYGANSANGPMGGGGDGGYGAIA